VQTFVYYKLQLKPWNMVCRQIVRLTETFRMIYTKYNEYNTHCVKQTTTTTNINTHFRLVKKWKQASVCHKSNC